MTKTIYFDMDGTIYDLYSVDGWLDMLENEDETAYSCGSPMYDMEELNSLLEQFVSIGFKIAVITWAAMNGSAEFNRKTSKVKRNWIKENLPCVEEFHCVKYGTPKHKVAKRDGVLIDDNEFVRNCWKNYRATNEVINANKNILIELEKLLASVK